MSNGSEDLFTTQQGGEPKGKGGGNGSQRENLELVQPAGCQTTGEIAASPGEG